MGTLASSQEMLDLALLFVAIGGVTLAVATFLHLIEVPSGQRSEHRSVFGHHTEPGPGPTAQGRSQGAALPTREAGTEQPSSRAVPGRHSGSARADDRPLMEDARGIRTTSVVGARPPRASEPETITDRASGPVAIGPPATTHDISRAFDRDEKRRVNPIAVDPWRAVDNGGNQAPSRGDSGATLKTLSEPTSAVEEPPGSINVQQTAPPELPPSVPETTNAASSASGPIESEVPSFELAGHYFRISGLRNPTMQDNEQ